MTNDRSGPKINQPTGFMALARGGIVALCGCATIMGAGNLAAESALPRGVYFNRPPLAAKPLAELPLGSIAPRGWLLRQLEIMAEGMAGRLDELYAEVCGERNAWLGGDGDAWERGPYWIDGLYPLAKLLGREDLEAKAARWIEWTLANQRPNGQIGPSARTAAERTRPPPAGAQTEDAEDWWPRMVMLKILQQHYLATGDCRVIECMTRYFRYQMDELPHRPLHDPANPASGSWWARQRGGDNVMSVLWLYNVTGEGFLLDLAALLIRQTHPWIEDFEARDRVPRRRFNEHHGSDDGYHTVNLAQALKYPAVFGQLAQARSMSDIFAMAWQDIHVHHGQPHGLWGGDEGMAGTDPTRGTEFCTISEAMFSLETCFEITGDARFGDRLERIAFNALPAQARTDYMGRQYFQQANQISCTHSPHKFTNYPWTGNLFGLLSGYPCCTCNMHQAWPKFAARLWFASLDGGLAAAAYAPNRVETFVAGSARVAIETDTEYPFGEDIRLTVGADAPVRFPLHLRIPEWCESPSLAVNGQPWRGVLPPGAMASVDRVWTDGDVVELRLPMRVRFERGHENGVSVLRGPLVFALRMEECWTETNGVWEVRSESPWNFALFERDIRSDEATVARKFAVEMSAAGVSSEPWSIDAAPIALRAYGVRNPLWGKYHDEAGPLPWSPARFPRGGTPEPITLVPYGCTRLRIGVFPTVW
ncbi:MAG: hypothetical protein EA424_13315 [Planctomycetaceae bacterium]|nr:MAG: hypothetical protein EA424_13315 [Planctomycetaceae bacterium]